MALGDLETLKEFEMISSSGKQMSPARSLSDFANIETLLVHHEILLPGRRASGAHCHSEKEKIALVLSGTPSAWMDGELVKLKEGDFVDFNKLEKKAHMIANGSEEEAVILAIGTNPLTDTTMFVDTQAH